MVLLFHCGHEAVAQPIGLIASLLLRPLASLIPQTDSHLAQ